MLQNWNVWIINIEMFIEEIVREKMARERFSRVTNSSTGEQANTIKSKEQNAGWQVLFLWKKKLLGVFGMQMWQHRRCHRFEPSMALLIFNANKNATEEVTFIHRFFIHSRDALCVHPIGLLLSAGCDSKIIT